MAGADSFGTVSFAICILLHSIKSGFLTAGNLAYRKPEKTSSTQVYIVWVVGY